MPCPHHSLWRRGNRRVGLYRILLDQLHCTFSCNAHPDDYAPSTTSPTAPAHLSIETSLPMWVLIVVPVLSYKVVIVLMGMVLIVYHCVDYPGQAHCSSPTPQEMARFQNAPQIQPLSTLPNSPNPTNQKIHSFLPIKMTNPFNNTNPFKSTLSEENIEMSTMYQSTISNK